MGFWCIPKVEAATFSTAMPYNVMPGDRASAVIMQIFGCQQEKVRSLEEEEEEVA